jgi:hypothetical protein
LYDNSRHQTHFTGFMLEEEIAASLWGFLTKIWLWMQLHLLNTHTKFQVSICKLWMPPSKTNFVCQIYKKREALKWEKIYFTVIRLRFGIFKKLFYRWINISVMHSSTKK